MCGILWHVTHVGTLSQDQVWVQWPHVRWWWCLHSTDIWGHDEQVWPGIIRGVTCDDVWGADPETGGGTHYCFCFFDRVFSISCCWISLYSSVMTRWWEIVCPDARTLIIQDKLVSISKNKTSLFNPLTPAPGTQASWLSAMKSILQNYYQTEIGIITSKICPN